MAVAVEAVEAVAELAPDEEEERCRRAAAAAEAVEAAVRRRINAAAPAAAAGTDADAAVVLLDADRRQRRGRAIIGVALVAGSIAAVYSTVYLPLVAIMVATNFASSASWPLTRLTR